MAWTVNCINSETLPIEQQYDRRKIRVIRNFKNEEKTNKWTVLFSKLAEKNLAERLEVKFRNDFISILWFNYIFKPI